MSIGAVDVDDVYGDFSVLPEDVAASLNSFCRDVHIVAMEVFAEIRYVIPASLAWLCRKYWTNDIKTIQLRHTIGTVERVAYLNIHGKLNITPGQSVSPVLFCHGDYGHPFTLLHLIDLSLERQLPTFSFYEPLAHKDEYDFERALFDAAIEKIKELVQQDGGTFVGVYGVGHSKGAIMLAEKQFVRDPVHNITDITATCAIGGRLGAIEGDTSTTYQPLIDLARSIYAAIQANPLLPLTQIVGRYDWNAPQAAMMVRPGHTCYSVGGSHLSCLYTPETIQHVAAFLPCPCPCPRPCPD